MTTNHTPGRLRAEPIPRDRLAQHMLVGEGAETAGMVKPIMAMDIRQEADARRLAACWNICVGIDTETLEAGALTEPKKMIEKLQAELDQAREDLAFVERWANHHGQKPGMTAAEALSVIQHYPAITEITQSYADGKMPSTPDPWAAMREALQAYEHAFEGLFAQCCSNPVKDAWGRPVDMTNLNRAHELAQTVLRRDPAPAEARQQAKPCGCPAGVCNFIAGAFCRDLRMPTPF